MCDIEHNPIRPNNLIKIPIKHLPGASQHTFVPSLMISNVMSLVPKIDELREVILNSDVEIACITETWLRDHIDDNVVNVSGFRFNATLYKTF